MSGTGPVQGHLEQGEYRVRYTNEDLRPTGIGLLRGPAGRCEDAEDRVVSLSSLTPTKPADRAPVSPIIREPPLTMIRGGNQSLFYFSEREWSS